MVRSVGESQSVTRNKGTFFHGIGIILRKPISGKTLDTVALSIESVANMTGVGGGKGDGLS